VSSSPSERPLLPAAPGTAAVLAVPLAPTDFREPILCPVTPGVPGGGAQPGFVNASAPHATGAQR
jgi:hypothetical protein